MRWRWDQGRLPYFQFNTICIIAKVLCSLDGLALDTKDDFLRPALVANTELPFAPSHYKVWRNYARVFQCAMLATSVDRHLVVTDLCRKLASDDPFSSDEYLNFVFSHYQLPYPAFNDYNVDANVVYPFVAILKFLISRNHKPIDLDDVFRFVVGNDCTGLEEISFYRKLKTTDRMPDGDEKRQVREMLVFMGQSSFIRWFDSKLYIDTPDYDAVLAATVPFISMSKEKESEKKILEITSLDNYKQLPNLEVKLPERNISEFSVKEGRKAFSSHQKRERSPLVREKYFRLYPDYACDACHIAPKEKYPWLEDINILELHHILPLSATLNINGTTTTLDDLFPLCPNCHKSIHAFYKIKLNEWGIKDFTSKKMAKDVYALAKGSIL